MFNKVSKDHRTQTILHDLSTTLYILLISCLQKSKRIKKFKTWFLKFLYVPSKLGSKISNDTKLLYGIYHFHHFFILLEYFTGFYATKRFFLKAKENFFLLKLLNNVICISSFNNWRVNGFLFISNERRYRWISSCYQFITSQVFTVL